MQYINEFLRFPGGKAKCLTLSYDDAVQQDQQLCDLMETYGIAVSTLAKSCGMNYINGVNTVTYFGAYFVKE